jgi:hypothetical protein
MNTDRARQLFAQAEEAFQRGYFHSVRRDFEFDHNERNHTARISNLINLQDFRRAREVLAEARKQYPDAVELANLASRLDFQAGRRG